MGFEEFYELLVSLRITYITPSTTPNLRMARLKGLTTRLKFSNAMLMAIETMVTSKIGFF